MAIAEKLEYLNGTKQAIKTAIQNRGVAVSDTDTFRDYSTKIGDIGEVVDKIKYGVSIDNIFGDVNDTGVLQKPVALESFNGVGIVRMYAEAFYNKFYDDDNIKEILLPDLRYYNYRAMLRQVGGNVSGTSSLVKIDLGSQVENQMTITGELCLASAFAQCSNLETVLHGSFKHISGTQPCYYAFQNCGKITETILKDVEYITGSMAAQHMYSGCASLKTTGFTKITRIGTSNSTYNNCCSNMFENCTSLESTGLDTLQEVHGNVCAYMFAGCTALKSTGLKNLTTYTGVAFSNTFSGCTALEDTELGNITEASSNQCFNRMFAGCTALKTTGLTNLKKIKIANACYGMFEDCTGLTDIGLDNLTTITTMAGAVSMFSGCSGLEIVRFKCLESILGASTSNKMFQKCTGLKKVFFPMLQTITSTNTFGNATAANAMFYQCNAMEEIHFRIGTQTVIEGMTNYGTKFGATNATIYFDLVGTITVNDVAYARDESKSVGETWIAWVDESGNIVYTDGSAEPAVDTVVYSDSGVTQVGTVSAIA